MAIVDRLITYLILSVIMFIIGISALTKEFPPPKQKIVEIVRLIKQVISSQNNPEVSVIPANLDQMLEVQKENLRKMEIMQKLMSLLKAIPQPPPSPEVAEKLQKISQHLQEAESTMVEVQQELLKKVKK